MEPANTRTCAPPHMLYILYTQTHLDDRSGAEVLATKTQRGFHLVFFLLWLHFMFSAVLLLQFRFPPVQSGALRRKQSQRSAKCQVQQALFMLGTIWENMGSCVPAMNDPPPPQHHHSSFSSVCNHKNLAEWGPWPGPRELTTLPTHTHTYTNVPQYHQAQRAPLEPNTHAHPLFLPFSPSLPFSISLGSLSIHRAWGLFNC